MFSLATKALFGFGVALFAASVVYGTATHEASGTTVLAFCAAGVIMLAAIAVAAGPDRPPTSTAASDAASDAEAVQTSPAGGRPLFPSVWPLGAAIAVGALALGASTSGVIVAAAVVVSVAAFVGWLFQAWTEHPSFTHRFGARLSDRFVAPLGLPAGVFALVAIIALSLSRVLLAVSVRGSRVVAIAVAIAILGSAFFIVSQERMARAALSILSAAALVAVVAAGAVGLAHGERTFEKKGAAPEAPPVTISAKDTNSFNTDSLTFPAERTVPLIFDNETPSTPHDVAIYDKQGGTELFKGALVTGVAQITYQVKPLAAGTYWFQCDVHPNMHGTLAVASAATGAAAGAAPGAGAGAPTDAGAAGAGAAGAGAAAGAATGASTTTSAPATATSTTLEVTAGFATTATTATTAGPPTAPTTTVPTTSASSTSTSAP